MKKTTIGLPYLQLANARASPHYFTDCCDSSTTGYGIPMDTQNDESI